MDKNQLVTLLEEKHQKLLDSLTSLTKDQWEKSPQNKWSSGQMALHLLQSIIPINNAMSLPKFFLKLRYGKSTAIPKDYAEVSKGYHDKLHQAKGPDSPFSKQIKPVTFNEKKYILNRLQMENKKLQYKTKKWKETDLNTYILPHPLMGKMPAKELILWTAYHVEHHTKQINSHLTH
ncbi:MAG TPA: DinB family protein [Flavobacteriaceae bacterium]|nr:DinB family protein [Flavobacteriaceae bacterium]